MISNTGHRGVSASGSASNVRTSKESTIRIVVADDHPLALVGIKALIASAADMQIVGEASDGETALQMIENREPHVAVIDIPIIGLTASDLARYCREHRPRANILVLTGHQDRTFLMELLQSGARGFLFKRSAPIELLRAIRTVLSGSSYVDPAIASRLLLRTEADDTGPAGSLSERELAVLKLVARGFGSKEIAAELGLSIKTVQTYKARAIRKLRLRTRADIVRYGAARGWIDEG